MQERDASVVAVVALGQDVPHHVRCVPPRIPKQASGAVWLASVVLLGERARLADEGGSRSACG